MGMRSIALVQALVPSVFGEDLVFGSARRLLLGGASPRTVWPREVAIATYQRYLGVPGQSHHRFRLAGVYALTRSAPV